MNKIINFSQWHKSRKYPVPDNELFQEICVKQVGSVIDDADAYIQIEEYNKYHSYYAFKNDMYKVINMTRKPKIVISSALFRQNIVMGDMCNKYFTFSWQSKMNDRGSFGPNNNPSDRFEKLQQEQNIIVNPWRKERGEYILILLPNNLDSDITRMIEKYGTIYNWLFSTIKEIKQYTKLPIVIRKHPRTDMYKILGSTKIGHLPIDFKNVSFSENNNFEGLSGGKYLEEDLKNAHCAISWSSSSLIEAACYGTPVYAMCGASHASEISQHDLSQIDNDVFDCKDRQQWLNDLAYKQWSYDEIVNGTAWEHIKNDYIAFT